MAAYHQVYDSRHLQDDCQEPGLAPEPYTRQSHMGYLYVFSQLAKKKWESDASMLVLPCHVYHQLLLTANACH